MPRAATRANTGDRWLSRALYIAASRHKDAFLTEYRADPNAVPLTALPLALRLGNSKPDWREPDAAALAADWKEMEQPGAWETKGLPNFDGVVWFTRTFEMPEGTQGASLTFGEIRQLVEVWVNGQAIAAPTGAPPTRGGPPARFEVPVAALKAGTNRISVRINNVRGDGGFVGKPELMAIEAKTGSVPLAGKWQYRVERQTNAPTLYGKPGELAAHLAMATRMAAATAGGREPSADRGIKALEDTRAEAAKPDVTIQLAVVPAQLKFDKSELTVNARQLVQLVFANTDRDAAQLRARRIGRAAADWRGRRRDGRAGWSGHAVRAAGAAGAVRDDAGRSGRDGDRPVPRAVAAGRLSVRVHVPGPLARDERHPARPLNARQARAVPLGRACRPCVRLISSRPVYFSRA